ncbi:MAG: DUF2723 domain-containing protein [Gemmatimonadales bacterium]|nr:DUF2723 domain-containing protein [Gemmatimonadales bacterium]
MTTKWYLRPQVLLAACVFVITLGVYVITLSPTAPFWDAGEFITSSHIMGVPHQPGTPLYVIFGRVFDVILGDADTTQAAYRTAWAVNFMSAFFSALAVMLVYLIIWELARRADPDTGWLAHMGGLVGAFFLAFSETFWNNATEAEVYGLAAFMLALLTWLAIKWFDSRTEYGSNQLLILVIYLLGLGVGFHLGTLLVYPGIFLLVLLAEKRRLATVDLMLMSAGLAIFLFSTVINNNALLIFVLVSYLIVIILRAVQGKSFALMGSALFFVGITVHMVLMIRAGASPEPVINQSDPDNFSTLMSVIRREQYPALNPFSRQAPLGFQYMYYYQFLFKQFYFLGPGQGILTSASTVLGPIFLALVGVFHGVRRLRLLILVPLVNYLINGEILTLYLNFTDHEVRERDYFYFAAFLFFAIFIGLGAAAIMRYAAGGEGKSASEAEAAGLDWRTGFARVKIGFLPKVLAVVLMLAAFAPIVPGHTKYFEHNRSDNRIAYEYAWNILAGLDENAIIFTNGDNDTFPIWYLQAVEHFRTDVNVVNLSLVNLPWYIKQIKHGEKPLAMQRTDAEIDALRHRIIQDPNTGEQQIIMIKDYLLHDIILTNYKMAKRPVFFAVTIPQEIMARYFPMLQMEGMAYRLLEEASEDKLPITDPDRVLENMLGVYRMGALMDGDSPGRQSLYSALSGLANDGVNPILGAPQDRLTPADYDTLRRSMGAIRRDVFRNKNAVHLLGNYPAAFNRAGYQFYIEASNAAREDTILYKEKLHNALTAFEASLAVAPFNEQAIDFYAPLLVQAYRDQDAKDFLSSMAGNIPVEMEERVVFNAVRGIARAGVPDLVLEWTAERIVAEPDRHFYYQVQFSLAQALGQIEEAGKVAEAWRERSGAPDPDMEQALVEMQQQSLDREEQRIQDAVEGNDGN